MFFIPPLASTELCVQSDRLNVDGMAAWAKERPWEMDQASRSVFGMFLTPVVAPVRVCVRARDAVALPILIVMVMWYVNI